ncbi:ATP-grasp domain-containing protein [Candidatus Babeliales bacterium]|nr:ATP-grasp domain-containing protein [Candidatus Babeliales bacterium]
MIRVGVFFGGKSIEREVSFNSGRTICDHLDSQLFQILPIFQTVLGDLYILPWSFVHRGKIADFEQRLETQAKKIYWDDLPSLIDFAYIAMHGKYAEDGRLQAILELFKIPYLGTKIFGSALGMNKILQNKYLKMHDIAYPKGFSLTIEQVVNASEKLLQKLMENNDVSFPVVIKPQAEGSSIGVFVAHDYNQLLVAIKKSCFITDDYGQDIMIEEKLQGMEFNAIVITDRNSGELIVLPPTEIMYKSGQEIFDYHHKYLPGAANKRTPAQCDPVALQNIKDVCKKTMQALHFSNIARIDGFLTFDGRIVILDSNPISGMGPSSFVFRQAAEVGISHSQLINHLIKTELKQYHMEKNNHEIMQQARIKIVVLFGGSSNEKEISLESGRNVCYKLSSEKYEVIPVFVDGMMRLFPISQQLLVSTSTQEIQNKLNIDHQIRWTDLKSKADFVFNALHGGPGENGIVQGTLEMLEIPYNGPSVFASALCMDKFKTAQFLQVQGFDVPQGFLFAKSDFEQRCLAQLDQFLQKIVMPCIIKPHDDGCSVMVSLVNTRDELLQKSEFMFQTKNFVLIEEYLIGMELTVGVVGNKQPRALAPSQSIAKKGLLSLEEKFLPGAGENQTPALLPEQDIVLVQDTMVRAYQAIGCQGYSRIDCFFQNEHQSPTGKKRVVVLEFNTLPALTPATCLFHQAAEEGLRPMELLDEIIQLGLQAHRPYQIQSVDAVLQKHESL